MRSLSIEPKLKVNKLDFAFFILAAVCILIVYGDIFKTFFQQDEWNFLGQYMYLNFPAQGTCLGAFLKYLKKRMNQGYVFAPLTFLIDALSARFFGLNFSAYASTSLFLHFLNTVLVFHLIKNLTRKTNIAFLAGLFFAINSTSYQAITWIGTALVTKGAAFFSILSLIFFVNYLEKKKRNFFWFSIISLFIALGFKETALFLFPFMIFYWFFSQKGKLGKKTKKDIFFLLAIGVVYLLTRLIFSFIVQENADSVQFKPLFSFPILIYQTLTIPLKTFSQVFIYPQQFFSLAEKWIELAHPYFYAQKETTFYGMITQTVCLELISYVLTTIFFLITISIYFLLKKAKETRLSKSLIFGVLLILIGTLPSVFLLLRGPRGILIMVRSRDLYISSIGAALLLSIVAIFLIEKIVGKKRRFFSWSLILLVFFFLFFYHQGVVKNYVFPKQIKRANQRKRILSQIKNEYPKIASKSIIYTESDTRYYGHAEFSLPFQSGFGRSILLWYSYYTKSHPLKFFEGDFLYLFNEEGYREIQGKGFGYFHHFDKLVKTVEEYNLPPESVYAFSWGGQDEKLLDITSQIRQRIKGVKK